MNKEIVETQENNISRRAALKLGSGLTAGGILSGLIGTAHASEMGSAAAPAMPGAAGTNLRKVALEEHFMTPEFLDYFDTNDQNISPELKARGLKALGDFGDSRLDVMDKNGVDYSVLSLSGPGVQFEKDAAIAKRKARGVNDFLAKEIQKKPARYGGFAHLAMQDPVWAAGELERCVRDLKFQGALINGQTNGEYLDLDKYSVFWERAAALEASIYIHPANPVDHPAMYAGHPELWGPVCSWAFETGTHALRLVFSGVFERYPNAKIILGHMGETLPISLWRFDSRWLICNRGGRTLAQAPSFYIKRNIAVTTAGVCSNEALQCALAAMGEDNVMFSIDYPFERTDIAAKFMENAPLDAALKAKVSAGNAARILKLNS